MMKTRSAVGALAKHGSNSQALKDTHYNVHVLCGTQLTDMAMCRAERACKQASSRSTKQGSLNPASMHWRLLNRHHGCLTTPIRVLARQMYG